MTYIGQVCNEVKKRGGSVLLVTPESSSFQRDRLLFGEPNSEGMKSRWGSAKWH